MITGIELIAEERPVEWIIPISGKRAVTFQLPYWPDVDDLDDMIEQLQFYSYLTAKQRHRAYLKTPIKFPPVIYDPVFAKEAALCRE